LGSGVTGQAHGAQFDSDRGILTLDADVTADTMQQGRPVRVTAAHGEVNRETEMCVFNHASYSAAGNTAKADVANVQLRSDGTAERVEMVGDVLLKLASGGVVRTPHAVAELNATSAPKDLKASGGVHYAGMTNAKGAQSESSGDSAAAHIVFDEHGVVRQAELSGGVHTLEREKDKGAVAWTERELRAATVVMEFQAKAGASPVLHQATASGEAQMRLRTPAKKAGTVASTLLAGDTLHAEFAGREGGLRTVQGVGHTVLTQTAADGTVNESRGDRLVAELHPLTAKRGQSKPVAVTGAGQIEHAVQQGHVTLTQTPSAGSAHAAALTVTAERAEYSGGDDSVVMTGTAQTLPQVSDGGILLVARNIRVMRGNGTATLNGSVSGNYTVAGAQSPAHIVADHGEIRHADQHAVFYGGGTQPRARLWQDASQVDAAVLDLDRAAQRLTAWGSAQDAAAVHVVFAGVGTGAPSSSKAAEVMRVASRRMVYSGLAAGGTDARRQADFTGGVRVETGDGTIHAQRAVVYMAGTEAKGGTAPLLLTGNVQRVVASGQVTLATGGRQGSGEELVYTPDRAAAGATASAPGRGAHANSGEFVLTGTASAPPRLVDPAKGSITGASLKFNSGDDSVVVSGGVAAAGRVRTELKVSR
jgi:lipopolysaccharide export system protein LptA